MTPSLHIAPPAASATKAPYGRGAQDSGAWPMALYPTFELHPHLDIEGALTSAGAVLPAVPDALAENQERHTEPTRGI